jgi:hypothetical protein
MAKQQRQAKNGREWGDTEHDEIQFLEEVIDNEQIRIAIKVMNYVVPQKQRDSA